METHMKLYIIFAIILCVSTVGGKSEESSQTQTDNVSTSVGEFQLQSNINERLAAFSVAIEKRNGATFISLTNTKTISLIRLFTSGNLGGRGEPLSRSVVPARITNEMAFTIDGQTDFSLPTVFPNLPIISFNKVLRRPLLLDAKQLSYDQWAPILLRSLKDIPEVADGAQVLLINEKEGCWVFADAQIIDDILVGGFAVFKRENNQAVLVAIIDLL